MYRIGIIGTENSHAMAFAKLINVPQQESGQRLFADAQVTMVFGQDKETANKVAQEANVAMVVPSAADMLGEVDAVMITSRKGSGHYEYAMPFIQKGIPLFVDKPFTSDVKQAKELLRLAEEKNVQLCGGSGCKLAYDIQMLQREVEDLHASQQLCSAALNFALDLHSPYDGIYFYAPHLVEMALTAFGENVREITATERRGTVVCVWRYDDYDVSLHFTKDSCESTAVLFGKQRNFIRPINIAMIYRQEVQMFIHMLRSGKMPFSYASLLRPVEITAAIEKALQSGQTVCV